MDYPEELVLKIKNKNLTTNSLSNTGSDPIPSLILPMQKFKNVNSLLFPLLKELKGKKLSHNQIGIKLSAFVLNHNIQKHNSSPSIKNLMLINDLIESKENHFIAIFKDYLISDYKEEFLRRFFTIDEIKEVLPKFYQYYKNYLIFFCKGTFADFSLNGLIQEYGEEQAEFYYNQNYGHKDKTKKKDKKGGIDENQLQEEGSDNGEDENISNLSLLKYIFTTTIQKSIEKVNNSLKKESYKELSNIKHYKENNKDNTISLPDNSSVTEEDIITQESSIRNMVELMHKKNRKIDLINLIKNKKNSIYLIKNLNIKNNNLKKNIYNNHNLIPQMIKKGYNSLSKVNSNGNLKNKPKIKGNTSNSRNKNIASISNYNKLINVLSPRYRNRSNEIKKVSFHDDYTLSMKKKSKNGIISFNSNELINNFNILSPSNIANNFGLNKHGNFYGSKDNSSIYLAPGKISNYSIMNKNIHNYNTLFSLALNKNINNKKRMNQKPKSESKLSKRQNKFKEKEGNYNGKYFYVNSNIKSFIKSIKNSSQSLKTNNNNNNINNKSLSYSTVNNCNININNNIILSNNYYNHHKYHNLHQTQMSNATKRTSNDSRKEKNIKFKLYRNNKNDINRFKTEVNMINSFNKTKINMNNSSTKFKSFRKSSKNPTLMKVKYLDKNKKYSNFCHKNLSLKYAPTSLRNNNIFNCKKNGRMTDIIDSHSNNKIVYIGLKKNITTTHQKKIIFDYKRK